MRGSALALLHFLAFSKVVHEQFYLPLYPLLLQLRIGEARLIEAIFTSCTLVNTGLFLIAPTLLFLIDYRLLQLQASIVYGDLGYISMNFIGPLVSSLIPSSDIMEAPELPLVSQLSSMFLCTPQGFTVSLRSKRSVV